VYNLQSWKQRQDRCIIGDAILPQTGTKLTKNAVLNLALCCCAIGCHREYRNIGAQRTYIAPSVKALQLLLEVCEQELDSLDMFINAKKSYYIRIGPRFNIDCHPLVTRDNRELKWCGSILYLGVSATVFRCSLSHNKQATYRAFNAMVGKVGRAASAEVMIQLFNSKCLPIRYYGIDVCRLTNTQINSLQFVINSCCTKIFMIKSNDDIRYCQDVFGCLPVADIVKRRTAKFFKK